MPVRGLVSPGVIRSAPGGILERIPMSERLRTLNAVFGQRRRRLLATQLSTEAVAPGNTTNASQPEPPSRLPVRALGEYVPGGRVDAMRRLIGRR